MSTACIIVIGNEILSGRTQDANIGWLARELNELGVRLAEARVIPDRTEIIIETVNACRPKFDYLFTTGGIGPTHDDITADAIARAFGVPLARHPDAEAAFRAHYEPSKLNAARLKMADVPRGAALIANPVSIAPGFRMENVYVMAGIPAVMQAMFSAIKHELKGGAKMLSKTLSAYVTEGNIAEKLSAIQNDFPDVEIGSYPFMRQGKLGTSLVARATDAKKLETAYGRMKALLLSVAEEVTEGEDLSS
jgi:molybdenum cofactor synthesis domain-containing protein